MKVIYSSKKKKFKSYKIWLFFKIKKNSEFLIKSITDLSIIKLFEWKIKQKIDNNNVYLKTAWRANK